MGARPAYDERKDEDFAEDDAAFEAATRGECVTHDAVKRWLASKATAAPPPCPKFGE